MSESTQQLESAQQHITDTREHIAVTAAELRHVVAQRAQAVDPRTYVREYPWIALGLALGAGVALAVTGAERKAAMAAADGARKLGGALADGANAAAGAVMHQFSNDDTAPEPAGTGDSGLRGRVRGAIDGLLYSGLEEILTMLGPSARRAQMSVGADGPSSVVSSERFASDESRAS
jgi:hypothetical protein